MEICTVGSVRGESIGKHAGAFSYSERRTVHFVIGRSRVQLSPSAPTSPEIC
jgi:hypothetical protein